MPTKQELNDDIMKLTQRFINLANKMKDEGKEIALVNTALMVASGTYGTFLTAGNDGVLTREELEALTQAYADNLVNVQAIKKQQLS